MEIGGVWVDRSIVDPTLTFGMTIRVAMNPRSIMKAGWDVVEPLGTTHIRAEERAADTIGLDSLKH